LFDENYREKFKATQKDDSWVIDDDGDDEYNHGSAVPPTK
jgi:hypothetical protein